MLEKRMKSMPVNLVLNIWIITGLVLMGISLYMFVNLANEFVEKRQFQFDQTIIDIVRSFSSPVMDGLMIFMTQMGSTFVIGVLLVIGMIWILVKHKNIWRMLGFLISIAGAGLLNLLLKATFERERPTFNRIVEADGFSFPSGHSMGSMVYYGFLVYLVSRGKFRPFVKVSLGILFGLVILLIGVSRIYLGVHYPSDVLAGYTAGVIWLLLCIVLFEVVYLFNGTEHKIRIRREIREK